MRAEPFSRIIRQLEQVNYIHQIVVTLGVAPDATDYRETQAKVARLGERA